MVQELIRVEDIHKAFGPVSVLEGVSFRIEDGDRVGVVGHNGSGKTTLLNTISNQDPDTGEVSFAPNLRIAYLTQIRDIDDGATLEVELSRKGRQFEEIDSEISDIEAKMADPAFYEGDWEPVMERYAQLQTTLGKSGGGDVGTHATTILKRLGLDSHPMDTLLNVLSGGERAKVALARQLVGLSQIDVLFLDEPTNHLDLPTLDWLEGFLSEYKGVVLVVSHDRYFLDRICNHILEVRDGGTKAYKGNYSSFIQQKELFELTLDDRIKKAEKEVKRLTGAMQSMKRANKFDKSISQKHYMLMRAQRELYWLKSIKPKKRKQLRFNLEASEKGSYDMVDIEKATLTFPGLRAPLLKEASVRMSRGQKVGIVGPNGVGKTTLLRLMNDELKVDSGLFKVSPGVQIGYFHQDHRTLDFTLTPIEQVKKLRPRMEYGDIRATLGMFQFSKEQVNTSLSSLSGGERARVALLKLLLEENNLLLLDEPTNHLDDDAKEALEGALADYLGSIITVSHDRWFLDKVCDTIWELPGGGVLNMWPGNYSDYLRAKS